MTAQLLSVLPDAPPPLAAQLPLKMQLLSVPPATPPPLPLVRVKPDKLTSFSRSAHEPELPPSIIVNSAPLTLRTDRGRSGAGGGLNGPRRVRVPAVMRP